ncbi:hypothetical protein [Mycobacterium neglectum]|jgi:hypothetical protein|nr:hypothetical protein [Mycobacterium neglectum]
MENSSTEAVFNRLTRRETALELVEAVEGEIVDSGGAVARRPAQ